MDTQELWRATLGELELTLSKANFLTWFKNTFITTYEGGRVIIAVPNTITKSWLEKKYHDAIIRALRNITNNGVRDITFRVQVQNTTPVAALIEALETQTESVPVSVTAPGSMAKPTTTAQEVSLNPRYTFDNFIVGKANELAHAAAMAVAAKPGENYNPLFIYGGSGLGKTHLLQAIGHHVMKTSPDSKVLYATCERFTNDFIHAVRSGRGKDFKDAYRGVDVLLIDDIQFMTGKEGTQEEFFHTFNALHQNNKQIIITADRQPKEIQGLESRLLSRFDWGMTADVSNPDFETRVAILEAKARDKFPQLGVELLRSIAGAVQLNVRELEGALNKILAFHQFKNISPTAESVQGLLQSLAPHMPKRNITPRRLIEVVVQYYDISMEEMLGKSREQRLAFPRQIAMYLLREEAKCSFPAIGGHLGSRDHTTAMHACSKINGLMKEDEKLRQDLSQLREKLYAVSST